MSEAGKVLEEADRVPPKGIVGVVRSTSDDDVQKGMAVMLEVLRHVGRASQAFAALGPRRNETLGIEAPAAAPAIDVPSSAWTPELVSPNIRRLTQLSSLATKELHAIPKPAGCL